MEKAVIITGGTRGIGRSLVEIFALNRYNVITCSRSEPALNDLKRNVEIRFEGSRIHIFRADLSNAGEVPAFIRFIEELQLPLDILINNAGRYIPGRVFNEPAGQLEEMISSNLYSAYNLTRGVLDKMISRKCGHIFNVCSTASIHAYPDGGSYSISKYALYGMSKMLREELKPFNIRVTSVIPGATYTSSWEGTSFPADRFMDSADVALMIWQCSQLSSRSDVEEIVIRPQLGDL